MKKAIILLSSFFLLGCEPGTSGINQEEKRVPLDYSLISDDKIKWDEVFLKPENDYYIYFYSELCGNCKKIKEDILSFYLRKMEVLYFVDVLDNEVTFYNDSENIIGQNSITDFYILGTPFLVEVNHHIITDFYAGGGSILDFIDSYK